VQSSIGFRAPPAYRFNSALWHY